MKVKCDGLGDLLPGNIKTDAAKVGLVQQREHFGATKGSLKKSYEVAMSRKVNGLDLLQGKPVIY